MITCDIETGPLPEDVILSVLPPFDPEDVKLGNLKDPVKVAAKIDEARENHAAKFIEKAALSPLTGEVLVSAIYRPTPALAACRTTTTNAKRSPRSGHNSRSFAKGNERLSATTSRASICRS